MGKSNFRKKMIIEECITKKCRGSWNDISLNSVRTVSLTDCKREFGKLKDDGVISDEEYNAIFSDEIIKELRPYKGRLQNLDDTELGIVSKDYFSDIVSYICKVELSSASSGRAWDNAAKAVAALGLPTDDMEMFDIPGQVFLSNNLDNIVRSCGDDEYPFIEKTLWFRTREDEDEPRVDYSTVVCHCEQMAKKMIRDILKGVTTYEEFLKVRDEYQFSVYYLSIDDMFKMAYNDGWDGEINLSKEPVQNPEIVTISENQYDSDYPDYDYGEFLF